MLLPSTTVRTSMPSPLGRIVLSASVKGLSGVWFDGQKHMPHYEQWPESSSNAHLCKAKVALTSYFEKPVEDFDLPLDLDAGTAFQQKVWRALLEIPFGKTVSYSQLSQSIGAPSAVRAVAGAVGRNPMSILVPCHRVIGSNGTLTGYAGGLDRKLALLTLEGSFL